MYNMYTWFVCGAASAQSLAYILNPKPNGLIMVHKPVAIKHDRANQILMNVTTYKAAATFKCAWLQVHQFWPNSKGSIG